MKGNHRQQYAHMMTRKSGCKGGIWTVWVISTFCSVKLCEWAFYLIDYPIHQSSHSTSECKKFSICIYWLLLHILYSPVNMTMDKGIMALRSFYDSKLWTYQVSLALHLPSPLPQLAWLVLVEELQPLSAHPDEELAKGQHAKGPVLSRLGHDLDGKSRKSRWHFRLLSLSFKRNRSCRSALDFDEISFPIMGHCLTVWCPMLSMDNPWAHTVSWQFNRVGCRLRYSKKTTSYSNTGLHHRCFSQHSLNINAVW